MSYNTKSQKQPNKKSLDSTYVDKNVVIKVTTTSSNNENILNKLMCQYCNKILSSRQSKWRHYKTCNKKDTIENKLLSLETKISEFEKHNFFVETLLDNHIVLLNDIDINSNMIKIIKKNYKLIYKNNILSATSKIKAKANIKILKKLCKIEHFNRSNTLDKILIKKLLMINTSPDSNKNDSNKNDSDKNDSNKNDSDKNNSDKNDSNKNDTKANKPMYFLYEDSSTASTSDYDSLT